MKPQAKKVVKKQEAPADEDFETMQQRILAETNDLQALLRASDEPVKSAEVNPKPGEGSWREEAARQGTGRGQSLGGSTMTLPKSTSPADDWNINSSSATPVQSKRPAARPAHAPAPASATTPKGPALSPAQQAFMRQQEKFREANANTDPSAAREAAKGATSRIIRNAESHASPALGAFGAESDHEEHDFSAPHNPRGNGRHHREPEPDRDHDFAHSPGPFGHSHMARGPSDTEADFALDRGEHSDFDMDGDDRSFGSPDQGTRGQGGSRDW